MPAPKKVSLATQAANVLRQQILEGELVNVLPGETPLAESLQISRKTVRDALAILESEALISSAEMGKRRSILTQNEPSDVKQNNVHILLPQPLREMHSSAQHLFRAFLQHLQIETEQVSFHHLPYASAGSNIESRAKELFTTRPASLWVVFELTQEIAAVIEQERITAIACGGISVDSIPVIAYHSPSATRHALHKLVQKGHTRIVKPSSGCKADTSFYSDVFQQAGIALDDEFHFPQYSSSTEGLSHLLDELFKNPNPPTAFITGGPRELIYLITWLASKKLSVPDDVSILHIGSDPLLDSIYPQISYYSTAGKPLAKELARLSRQLLENPKKEIEDKSFYMEYEAGESLAQAPA